MPDIANSASTRIEEQQDHIGLCCGLDGWLWLARSTRQSFNGAILGADGGCPGHVKQATYRIVLDSHTPLWSVWLQQVFPESRVEAVARYARSAADFCQSITPIGGDMGYGHPGGLHGPSTSSLM
ncbi:hypothetical protein FVEG_14653 [Fusarium verticillioides 7600]|uniref:Uncharacterized protein n=1 Tax=Gibberella moniliformis (strain M3125 / FGSC 7600) TaxID=334819 RepID=W7LLB7_GIBM7|nr:hypothetical protein FVEG_14653 [Fusarium verticillioides 7600]EWG36325.1 hypothetical protein FVEG_14653 [Fusarium verticillioides 7600]RBQ84135.1 hypothetical protein FVER53263_20559 [Fusarium verticillioides]